MSIRTVTFAVRPLEYMARIVVKIVFFSTLFSVRQNLLNVSIPIPCIFSYNYYYCFVHDTTAIISRPLVIMFDAFLLYVFFLVFMIERDKQINTYFPPIGFHANIYVLYITLWNPRDVRAATCWNVGTKREKKLDVNQKVPFGLGEGHRLLLRLWLAAHTRMYHARLSPSYKPRSLPYSSARHTVIVNSLSGSCQLKPEQKDVEMVLTMVVGALAVLSASYGVGSAHLGEQVAAEGRRHRWGYRVLRGIHNCK